MTDEQKPASPRNPSSDTASSAQDASFGPLSPSTPVSTAPENSASKNPASENITAESAAAEAAAVKNAGGKKSGKPPTPPPPIPPAPSAKPARAGLSVGARLTLALALLLSLAAVGAAGYLFYIEQLERVNYAQDQMGLASQLQTRDAQITALKNEVQQATQQLAQDRTALMKANESRAQLQGRLAALEKDIAQVTGAHRIDWMLQEVEHFVFVAERRLSLLGDASGALALLQEADDIARAMQEPAARPLRDALIKDMNNLKRASETNLDTDGIFLRINQLVERVPALNIPRYELYQEPGTSRFDEPLPEAGLPLFWRRFTDFVRSLVRFEKHEKAKPLLLTAERDYLSQSIVLLLEQSQLALLRSDSLAYRLSLTEARNRVDSYIHLQTTESTHFITELDALAQVKLRPSLPTIQDSVRAVQVFRGFWSKEKIEREQLLQKIERQSGTVNAPAASTSTSAPAAAPASAVGEATP